MTQNKNLKEKDKDLPVAIPQKNGGYLIVLKSKDLPAEVIFPSNAKVIEKK